MNPLLGSIISGQDHVKTVSLSSHSTENKEFEQTNAAFFMLLAQLQSDMPGSVPSMAWDELSEQVTDEESQTVLGDIRHLMEVLRLFVRGRASASQRRPNALPTPVSLEMAPRMKGGAAGEGAIQEQAWSDFWDELRQLTDQEQRDVLKQIVRLLSGWNSDERGKMAAQAQLLSSSSSGRPAETAAKERLAERFLAMLMQEEEAHPSQKRSSPLPNDRPTPTAMLPKDSGDGLNQRSSPLPGDRSPLAATLTKDSGGGLNERSLPLSGDRSTAAAMLTKDSGEGLNVRQSSSWTPVRSLTNLALSETTHVLPLNGEAGLRLNSTGAPAASSETGELMVTPQLLTSGEPADGTMGAKAHARPALWQPQSFADTLQQYVLRQLYVNPNGVSEASLSLYPESLGQVDVRISSHNGILSAHLIADTWLAKELLEGQLDHLRQALQNQGLQVHKLEVSIGQQGTPSRHFSQHARERDRIVPYKREQPSVAAERVEGYAGHDLSRVEQWRNPHASINYTV